MLTLKALIAILFKGFGGACFASAISVRPHGTFESSQISAR